MLPIPTKEAEFYRVRYEETNDIKYMFPLEHTGVFLEFENALKRGWPEGMHTCNTIDLAIENIFSSTPDIIFDHQSATLNIIIKCSLFENWILMKFTVGCIYGLELELLEKLIASRVVRRYCGGQLLTREVMNFLFLLAGLYEVPYLFLNPCFYSYLPKNHDDTHDEHREYLLQSTQDQSVRKSIIQKIRIQQYEQCEKRMPFFKMLNQHENISHLEIYKKELLLVLHNGNYFSKVIPFSNAQQIGYYLSHKDDSFRNLLSLFYGNQVCPLMDALSESQQEIPPEIIERIGWFISALLLL